MTKNLKQRAEEAYENLDARSKSLVRDLRGLFGDYFSGKTLEPHEHMMQQIGSSGLTEERAYLVLDYCFLNCAQARINSAVEEFVSLADELKYNPAYSLCNFLHAWDSERKDFTNSERARGEIKERAEEKAGTYFPLLVGMINHLERTRELKNYMYGETAGFTAGMTGFDILGLISVMASNSEIIEDILVESTTGKLRDASRDIVSGKNLANEAAGAFLDAYDSQKDSALYRRGLEMFLERFDIGERRFVGRNQGGTYRALYSKLTRKHRASWKTGFLEMLREPLKTRAAMLDRDLAKNGGNVMEEDRIRFVEGLSGKDMIKYLALVAEDGSDSEDILLAARIGSLGQKERKMLLDITSQGRTSLAKYLGMCRMPVSDSAINYDARACLEELCNTVDPAVFAQNEVLAAILFNKFREQYASDFSRNRGETIARLKREIEHEKNDIKKELLQKTLEHYELRLKVENVKGLKKKLVVIS